MPQALTVANCIPHRHTPWRMLLAWPLVASLILVLPGQKTKAANVLLRVLFSTLCFALTNVHCVRCPAVCNAMLR